MTKYGNYCIIIGTGLNLALKFTAKVCQDMAKKFINEKDSQDYSFVKQYLDSAITVSPHAMDYTNSRTLLNSNGFSKFVVIKKMLSKAVRQALIQEGYTVNVVAGGFTEVYKLES